MSDGTNLKSTYVNMHTHFQLPANPSVIVKSKLIATLWSGSSLFREREDLGETFYAPATVTIFSNSSTGPTSAVHVTVVLCSRT
jgi:hypothetical protein